MRHQTFERFQGMWWGSIVGQAVANQKQSSQSLAKIEFPPQSWLTARQKIAKILLDEPILEVANQDLSARSKDKSDLASSVTNVDLSVAEISPNLEQLWSFPDTLNPLSLLPLLFGDRNYQELWQKVTKVAYFQSPNLDQTTNNTYLIWNHLLNQVLHSESEPWQLDLELMLQKTIIELAIGETTLINQLKLVVQAVAQSKSLAELSASISFNDSHHNFSTAIALSWYCFITTPQDFQLSVLRTANLRHNLAGFTSALTGTLSGAYNGMAVIPWSWRTQICHSAKYFPEQKLMEKLFKNWLGIYLINNNHELYSYQINAVASSPMIQPRKALKIISHQV